MQAYAAVPEVLAPAGSRQALEAAGAETAPPDRQRPSLRRRLRRALPWLLATSALLAAASTVWLIF